MPISDLTAIATLVLALVIGLSSWLTARRVHRGRVGTSEAAVLWKQTETLINAITARAEAAEQRTTNAEAQRDRLLDTQASQLRPAIEVISASQKQMVQMVGEILERLERNELIAREASRSAEESLQRQGGGTN